MQVDEKDARDIVLEPGQFSLHHVGIVHGSDPNNSDLPRYGYTIRRESTHESIPATTESGDLWLSADVPFGLIKHTAEAKDDAGNVTMTYERVLVGSGTKKTD